MKKISAHYIFPLNSSPLKNGIIVLNKNGIIQELIDTKGEIKEIDRLEFHSGILIPEIEGLTISELLKEQETNPLLPLNEILKGIKPESQKGFIAGQKTAVYLIYPLDILNMKLTEKSKLKKLV